jgi:hypothetical protein
MKLTESRIKEIIQEEMENAKAEKDETKTLQEFKQFLINLAKQSSQIKGASAMEIKEIAELIVKMVKSMSSGEVSQKISKADDLYSKIAGEQK